MSGAAPKKLTPREREIAALWLRDFKRAAMASELSIHIGTVDFHLANIRRKCGAHGPASLAVFLLRRRS